MLEVAKRTKILINNLIRKELEMEHLLRAVVGIILSSILLVLICFVVKIKDKIKIKIENGRKK